MPYLFDFETLWDGKQGLVDYILGAVLQVQRHDLAGDREKDKFSPSVTYEYDIDDDAFKHIEANIILYLQNHSTV